MAPTHTSTASLEAEDPVQPRRSSRVTTKANTKSSSTKISTDAKKNGAAKPKAGGSKKSDKALAKAEPTEPSDDASPSAPGEPEKHPNSDEVADEDHEPSAAKKAKTDVESSDDKPTSKESGSKKKLVVGEKLVVGDKLVEGIELSSQDEKKIDIFEAVKEKGAIIFIYPKANTPGCTNQACGFRDLYQEIVDAGYQVFGLSRDSPKSQKNWKDKQTLPYTLLCDPEQQLIKLLGASKSATTVQRSHYIIAPGGEILNITSPASPKNGPQEALDFIKNL